MGSKQLIDDDALVKSLLRCYTFKKRARKEVFHNKTFYKHTLKVHSWKQKIREQVELDQDNERQRQLDLQQQRQQQQQIEYQQHMELQQYQQQLAYQEQQQQQEHQQQQLLQQQQQQEQYQFHHHQQEQVAQEQQYQCYQIQYQPQEQLQGQEQRPSHHFQMKQDYGTDPQAHYMQYSDEPNYQETSVKIEQRISLLESLETPPPSDLPAHPPPSSSSSASSSSFIDNTLTSASLFYENFAPIVTDTIDGVYTGDLGGSCVESVATSALRSSSSNSTSSGLSSGGSGSNQGYHRVVCSPRPAASKFTLTFPMTLPRPAEADVDIMRRNLWTIIVRKEMPQARKRKMSFKDQKRSKSKLLAQRATGYIKEFRRKNALKADRLRGGGGGGNGPPLTIRIIKK